MGGNINPKIKKILRLALQAFLIGLVFFFLGRKIYTDWPEIRDYPWEFDVPWLIASIVLMGVMYIGHATIWLVILRRFKHPVPALPGYYVWFKSLIARYVPGNVLMVLGRVVMIEPYGVPKRVSLTSVAYEQALLVATATTVIATALPFWPKLQAFSSFIWLVLLVPPLAIAMLHPKLLDLAGNWVLRKAGRETIEDFLPFKDIIWIFCLYAAIWVVAGLGLYAMASAVTKMEFTDLPIVIASAPLAWLISVLFFISPSGLGVREGVYAYTLDFAFENAGVASAFAILMRFWQTLLEIGVVLVVMALVKIRHIKMKTAAAGSVDDVSDGPAPPL